MGMEMEEATPMINQVLQDHKVQPGQRVLPGATGPQGLTGPQGAAGVVFDGNNIWVTNQFDNTVTKLRSSDGEKLGTFAVGLKPNGMAFDGANVWVANSGGNTLSKR
jgi:DNA-binding beta-propeller fold protein YncE